MELTNTLRFNQLLEGVVCPGVEKLLSRGMTRETHGRLDRLADGALEASNFGLGKLQKEGGVCDAAGNECLHQAKEVGFFETMVAVGYAGNESANLVGGVFETADNFSISPIFLNSESENANGGHVLNEIAL